MEADDLRWGPRPTGLELFILTLTFRENVRPLFEFFLDVTT